MHDRPYDIRERSFLFAGDVIRLCRPLATGDYVLLRLAGQLVKSAGSVGANLEEAHAAQSKPDFISKNCIALKECREARFWLRLIGQADERMASRVAPLIQESTELIAIIATIILNARQRSERDERK